eukprot:12086634-Karenia_brevis.AAC.1
MHCLRHLPSYDTGDGCKFDDSGTGPLCTGWWAGDNLPVHVDCAPCCQIAFGGGHPVCLVCHLICTCPVSGPVAWANP